MVWVGFDDNRDLGLSGSASAAPIWAEFMKRAVTLPEYKNPADFEAPDGVLQVTIDPQSGELASSACPQSVQEYFIAGSEPTLVCDLHGPHAASAQGGWLSHLFGKGNPPPPPGNGASSRIRHERHYCAACGQSNRRHPNADADAKKKKGLLEKVFGIFGVK